ncbi:hypothetical protein [Actinomadura alba]|uniref:HEPN domain-containing protein n=1 Tax=Actinomadura alba TaxID=406431 RepID=A0ABR7LIZ3_9ACTN|nr:hypothetical protein [Actinomadura alba]MBC6464807.1 hypothetical protein [Actinomadura alba]
MRWEQGRADIEGMLQRGELERVPPSRSHADELIAQARAHLVSAKVVAEADAVGAFQLLYDAARKVLCGVLANQGLRATSRGGHIVVYEALAAQLDPPLGPALRPFDRMRRRRNHAEYPQVESPQFTTDEALREAPKVEKILDLAVRVTDQMSPY